MENNEKQDVGFSKKTNIYLIALLILLLTSIINTSITIIGDHKLPMSRDNDNRENIYNFYMGKDAVQVINIYGVIEYEKMLPDFLQKLKIAEESKSIKAVILRINSPGGTVGASQAIYKAILTFKEKTNKPVLSVFGDVAASGGYYIAMATDEIFAHAGTITGSIGVIIMGFNFERLFKTVGVEQEIIKSGQFKDIFSSIATSQTPAEKKLLQEMVDQTYSQFYQVVKEGRKGRLPLVNLRKYTDGRIFNGAIAKNLGFIDKIGSVADAIESLKNRFKLKNILIIDKNRSKIDELFDYFMSSHYEKKRAFYLNRGTPLYLYFG